VNSSDVTGRQGYGVTCLNDGGRLKFLNLVTENSQKYNAINLIRPGCKELKIIGLA